MFGLDGGGCAGAGGGGEVKRTDCYDTPLSQPAHIVCIVLATLGTEHQHLTLILQLQAQ